MARFQFLAQLKRVLEMDQLKKILNPKIERVDDLNFWEMISECVRFEFVVY